MEPIRGPRGAGHTKEKNVVPPLVLEEILMAALQHQKVGGGDVVVDLCAGFQSLAPVAREFGCRYVAVDILGVLMHKCPRSQVGD